MVGNPAEIFQLFKGLIVIQIQRLGCKGLCTGLEDLSRRFW